MNASAWLNAVSTVAHRSRAGMRTTISTMRFADVPAQDFQLSAPIRGRSAIA